MSYLPINVSNTERIPRRKRHRERCRLRDLRTTVVRCFRNATRHVTLIARVHARGYKSSSTCKMHCVVRCVSDRGRPSSHNEGEQGIRDSLLHAQTSTDILTIVRRLSGTAVDLNRVPWKEIVTTQNFLTSKTTF